jgi:hypothetical protein
MIGWLSGRGPETIELSAINAINSVFTNTLTNQGAEPACAFRCSSIVAIGERRRSRCEAMHPSTAIARLNFRQLYRDFIDLQTTSRSHLYLV